MFESIYILSEKKLLTLCKYLAENEKKKFIRKFQLRAEYSILFIFKKDGELRLYIDYRKLNNITIKNCYLLLNISKLQNRLFGAKYFIKLDLQKAYNQIRIKTEEKWKTAFCTRYKLYEYLIMLFGLTNVSAICQKVINNILQQYLNIFVIAYLDNIIIYSETLKQYIQHIFQILECLNKRNLYLKSEKCKFYREEVDFLEFIVEQHKIRIDLKKLETVKK